MSERRLCQHVVGDPVRELGERVRGARRDDEQVGARQVRVEVLARGTAREREKRPRRHELLGALRDERDHVVSRAHEGARQLTRLVGGDTSAHAEQDPAHTRSVTYFFGYS